VQEAREHPQNNKNAAMECISGGHLWQSSTDTALLLLYKYQQNHVSQEGTATQ
jgi:hypothetical protein